MKEELKESLYSRFPDLYWQRTLGENSCMHFGPVIGDGWYTILESLSVELTQIISARGLNPKEYCFSQIKEKFGLLRIYFHRTTTEIEQATYRAEKKSAVTCETCGVEGRLREEGWKRVACDRCEERYQERQREREAEAQKRRDVGLSRRDSGLELSR